MKCQGILNKLSFKFKKKTNICDVSYWKRRGLLKHCFWYKLSCQNRITVNNTYECQC